MVIEKSFFRAIVGSMEKAGSGLNAVFLLGTLKKPSEISNTAILSEILVEELDKYGVNSKILQLSKYNIPPGTRSNMSKNDDWPKKILPHILKTDILIFATPIWWGTESSLTHRAIERMDELNDELLKTGNSPLSNKIGGIVITGSEDGAQHIIGNLCNFMSWNGLTVPPACSLSWLGDPGKTKTEKRKKILNKPTRSMLEVMARNLVFYAKLLKKNPLPKNTKGGVSKYIP